MTGEQLGIDFSPAAHARRRDPDTSREAAESVAASVPRLAGRLLDALKLRGPMTRTEVATAVGMSEYQASKRLSDLKNAELIIDSGQRRAGPSGREQIVWAARPV